MGYGRPILSILQATYVDRASSTRLPILADALEEGGCTDTDILNHCRGPGPHVRGLLGSNLSAVDIASPLSILKVVNVVELSGVRAGSNRLRDHRKPP